MTEATEPDLRTSATKGFAWSATQSIVSRLVATLVFIILARLVEPRDFGLIALASVFVIFFTVFAKQGFGRAVIQRAEVTDDHLDTAFWLSLGSGVGMTVILVALSPLLSALMDEPQLGDVLRLLSLTFVLQSLATVPEALLARNLNFRSIATRSVLSSVLGGVAGIAAALAGWGVWSLCVQMLVQAAVGAIVVMVAVPWRPHLNISREAASELWTFGSWVTASGLLNFASRRGDDLLIGSVLGSAALGIYAVAYRVLMLMTDVLMRTMDAVAFPVLSALATDPARQQRAYLGAIHRCALISIPAFAGLGIASRPIVLALFGPEWIEAIPIMRILCGVGALQSILYFNDTLMLANGKPRLATRWQALNALFNVAAFFASVHFGIVAVSAAFLCSIALSSPISFMLVRRMLPDMTLRHVGKQVASAFLGSLVMSIVVVSVLFWLPAVSPYVECIAAVVVGATTYTLFLRTLYPGSYSIVIDDAKRLLAR
jgi:O-antigen/teichoic acid export membrane protein